MPQPDQSLVNSPTPSDHHLVNINHTHHHQHAQKLAPNQTKQTKTTINRNRLPTLQEVVGRQTRPPVDLYCFYLYLQREKAEDSLDFWLDAQQHENLCRAYFKDLRKSAVDLQNEWPAYYQYARSRGSVYNPLNRISRGNELDIQTAEKAPRAISRNSSRASHKAESGAPSTGVSPALRALFPHDQPINSEDPKSSRSSQSRRQTIQPIIPRSSAITQADLVASAERIYYRYLLSGAEKEIYLPSHLRIHDFPLNSTSLPQVGTSEYEGLHHFMATVPDLFVHQKEYIFRSMERDTFPRFLSSQAFGNLTPLSSKMRLYVGLFAVWVGLSVGISLILLDVHPRGQRLWSILPLTIGAIGIVGHLYDLDPILMLFNRSETRFCRTLSIKEKYVRKILRGRAVWVTTLSILTVAIIDLILIFIPGHRL